MVPFSKCFFIAFLMRNFFFSISIPGYFFTIYFKTDWYETPALLLQDCKDSAQRIQMHSFIKPNGINVQDCWGRAVHLLRTIMASMRISSTLC